MNDEAMREKKCAGHKSRFDRHRKPQKKRVLQLEEGRENYRKSDSKPKKISDANIVYIHLLLMRFSKTINSLPIVKPFISSVVA